MPSVCRGVNKNGGEKITVFGLDIMPPGAKLLDFEANAGRHVCIRWLADYMHIQQSALTVRSTRIKKDDA